MRLEIPRLSSDTRLISKMMFVFACFILLCVPVNCLPPDFPAVGEFGVPELLLFYVQCGLTYKLISRVMAKFHGIHISDNGIRKRIKRFRIPSRRGSDVVPDDVLLSLIRRIEAWWSFFRKRTSQWWMDFFKDLVDSGNYVPCDNIAIRCMRFSFLPLIQMELDNVVEQWNKHQMSVSRNTDSPNGRPNVLFALPELTGGKDCIQNVDDECINFGFSKTQKPNITGDEDFDNFATELYTRLGWRKATTWKEALKQYFILLDNVPN